MAALVIVFDILAMGGYHLSLFLHSKDIDRTGGSIGSVLSGPWSNV